MPRDGTPSGKVIRRQRRVAVGDLMAGQAIAGEADVKQLAVVPVAGNHAGGIEGSEELGQPGVARRRPDPAGCVGGSAQLVEHCDAVLASADAGRRVAQFVAVGEPQTVRAVHLVVDESTAMESFGAHGQGSHSGRIGHRHRRYDVNVDERNNLRHAVVTQRSPEQFTSIRYGQHLADLGATPSIGSVGDSYDNALAETINGLYKTECIRGPDQGPWRTVGEVELATLAWVHWFNHQRLHGYLGGVPPTEFEAAFYAAQLPVPIGIGTQ